VSVGFLGVDVRLGVDEQRRHVAVATGAAQGARESLPLLQVVEGLAVQGLVVRAVVAVSVLVVLLRVRVRAGVRAGVRATARARVRARVRARARVRVRVRVRVSHARSPRCRRSCTS
jgi:hypothetical protein